MRRRRLWLGLLCGSMIVGNASAFTVNSIDGHWDEWLSTDGTQLTDPDWGPTGHTITYFSGVSHHLDDPSGDANGPGAGGQPYDAEDIMWAYDAATPGKLYVGLVTGFSPFGEAGNPSGGVFHAGDLFIDIGDDHSYEYAVGTSKTSGDVRAGDFYENGGLALPTEGVYYDGSAPNGDTTHVFTASNPYRADKAPTDTNVTAHFAANSYGTGSAKRWFYEFCIDFGSPGAFAGDPIGLHWTMECGNDNINATIPMNTTPLNPVPIPAAAPLALLGMGVVGLAGRFRRTLV